MATKTTTKSRGAAAKPPTSVDDYIAAAPSDKRAALARLRKTIRAAAPGATEAMSYGIVGYKYRGERLIYFGYWRGHVGLYGFSSAWIAAHADELARYDLHGSTLRFTPTRPLPVVLVRKILKGRIAEIERRR